MYCITAARHRLINFLIATTGRQQLKLTLYTAAKYNYIQPYTAQLKPVRKKSANKTMSTHHCEIKQQQKLRNSYYQKQLKHHAKYIQIPTIAMVSFFHPLLPQVNIIQIYGEIYLPVFIN